jgi:chlorophyll synthase
LLKPITWFPPMWAFGCGVVASGVSAQGRWPLIVVGVVLAGPLVCASSQAVNDWFDRSVALNEPLSAIPSGRMPGRWGLHIPALWTALSLLLAWAYSVPPLRLKRNGWWGNAAYGLCYEGFAWTTGAAVMAGGAMPELRSLLLALAYSVSAHGIMTLNDFSSVKGDRQMGIGSLPVLLGIDNAARAACWVMIAPQLLVAALLAFWQRPLYALTLAALIAAQLVLMRRFRRDPTANAIWYSGFGVPLLMIGMMVSAFGLRGA